MKQIMVIEDDIGLNQGLCKALKNENCQLISCYNLKTAKEQLSCQSPELIILDLNLPDGNGLSLLRELREKSENPPIILLTANDTDDDVVNGLELGADDYITKPFSLVVLRARVNTQLRKSSKSVSSNTFQIDCFLFDFDKMQFFVNNAAIELSKTEHKLLRLLVENRGRIMERAILVDRIWTDGSDFVDENALSVTIKRLRDKLQAQKYIKTVYGIGYTWVNDHE